MKKAVIKIKVEYDHSHMLDDMQVIDAIEGIGSNIVTLMNKPGSPLWLNFGAHATVRAIGSNIYVDKVDMPLPDVLKQQWQEGANQMTQSIDNALMNTKANELDRYAIPAMQGLLAGRLAFHDVMVNAIKAYDQAEAMIAERNKRTQ